jgi:F0F1-type ATP synthase membrane subunit a
MNELIAAQAGAQLVSLLVYGAVARWYVMPWLQGRNRADALIALLWVHVFRYVALQVFSAQRDGFPISDGGAMNIVIGDVAGAAIAFVAIMLLRNRSRAGVAMAWLLVAETIYDTVDNIRGGIHEHLMGAASGVTWIVLTYFVPMVVVSLVLTIWQLYSRRGETLDPGHPSAQAERPSAMAGATHFS